jgi:hypothetical protein
MKNAQPTEIRPSALDALTSIAIIANNPSTQQAFALLALMLGYAVGVVL